MSEERRKAEVQVLRTAGWMPQDNNDAAEQWYPPTTAGQIGTLIAPETMKYALALVAAERAREDRAHLATLASGFAAQGRHPVECAVYARETFKNLYGYALEIGTPLSDDAAAKVTT